MMVSKTKKINKKPIKALFVGLLDQLKRYVSRKMTPKIFESFKIQLNKIYLFFCNGLISSNRHL
jgi:hypothetical protein